MIKLTVWMVGVGAILWAADMLVDYEMSLAVVHGGLNPGFAALDEAAFQAVVHPTETTPSFSRLSALQRIISVPEGTKCQMIKAVSVEQCQGEHYEAIVRLLDGPQRGKKVWMCSDSFEMVNHWF